MKIDKNSLLWRLATVYGPMWDSTNHTNVCKLWRSILLGGLVCCLLTAAGVLAGVGVGSFLFWVYISLTVHSFFIPVPALLISFIVVGLALFAAGLWLMDFGRSRLEKWSGPKSGGLIDIGVQRVVDWHSKICTSVTITDGESQDG